MLEQPHKIGKDRFAGEAESLLGAAFVITGKAKETVGLRDLPSAITLRYFKTRKAPVQTRQASGVP